MNILKWLIAILAGAVLPALVFEVYFLDMPWTTVVQPEWAWATVAILPLASGALLFLSAERFSRIVRPVCLAIVLHAIVMFGLWFFGVWRAVAIISLIIDVMLLVVLVRPAVRLRAGRFAKATIFWVVVVFGFGIPVGCAYSLVVMWRAEEMAGDRPYCIQYANQSHTDGYEPARTLFDVSALKMRTRLASGGSSTFFWQNHAILVIEESGRQFFNWSYMRGKFLDEVVNRRTYTEPGYAYKAPQVVCQPSAHYARGLPAWSPSVVPFEVNVGERHFVVPQQYRPRSRDESLILDAEGPAFEAYEPSKRRAYSDPNPEIVIKRGDSTEIARNLERRQWNAPGRKDLDPEFGLKKREVSGSIFYTGHDENGRPVRFIQCWQPWNEATKRSCYYAYTTNGLSVNLSIADPSQWQAIEPRLQNMILSFEKRPSS